MGATTHSIDINAPLHAVYNQWTQFEEFPRFMEGVEEVRQDGPRNLFWKARIAGKEKQWEAEIVEQIPDQRITWQSIDGTPNSGEVTFERLDEERTRVILTMEYEPEGFLEKAGDALGIPSGRAEGDLKRFRDLSKKEEQRPVAGMSGSNQERLPNPFLLASKQNRGRLSKTRIQQRLSPRIEKSGTFLGSPPSTRKKQKTSALGKLKNARPDLQMCRRPLKLPSRAQQMSRA